MLDQILHWAGINSGTQNLTGLAAMASELASAFSVLPGTVELIDPAPVESVSPAGEIVTVQAGQHLVVRVRPEASRRILLTGHMDTVFPVDHPFQHCVWLDDQRLRGPGVLDMKAGLAIMLAGLCAFEATKPSLGYDILINSDEETGSLSSSALIRELAQGKHAALTYEPTMPGGVMARARPGSGNYAALIHGRAAHAGRNPQDGRNAIVAASDLALRLSKARKADLAINPARIDGGGPNNVVPDLAVLRFNVRPKGSDEMAESTELVSRLTEEIGREHDVRICLHGGMGRPAKPITPATEKLFAMVSAAASELGAPLAWTDSGGVCDGNNIADCGVPVLDTMGAIGEFIHSPDEYLDTLSLIPKARLTTLVLSRLDQGQ
ncbi:MAG: hydrolase [Sphingomonadales bacterium]|nr:MAG: hydrolase [Sphingomonadales bacterium]